MNTFIQTLSHPIKWIIILLFIFLYPMLISIYVFLPLFIGIFGYILILGLETKKVLYIVISCIYFVNLEANLSLPFFITIIAALSTYVFFFNNLNFFKGCQVCKPIILVLLMNIVYLALLTMYDFIFQTTSVVYDYVLLYTVVVDMLVVVML